MLYNNRCRSKQISNYLQTNLGYLMMINFDMTYSDNFSLCHLADIFFTSCVVEKGYEIEPTIVTRFHRVVIVSKNCKQLAVLQNSENITVNTHAASPSNRHSPQIRTCFIFCISTRSGR